jgi:hypothetical protein
MTSAFSAANADRLSKGSAAEAATKWRRESLNAFITIGPATASESSAKTMWRLYAPTSVTDRHINNFSHRSDKLIGRDGRGFHSRRMHEAIGTENAVGGHAFLVEDRRASVKSESIRRAQAWRRGRLVWELTRMFDNVAAIVGSDGPRSLGLMLKSREQPI